MVHGRRTWEHFTRLWPGRDGDVAELMNTVPKRVATSWRRSGRARHDPGKVLIDLAMSVALRGDCDGDFAVAPGRPALFGPVS